LTETYKYTFSENIFPYFLYCRQNCEEHMGTAQGQLACRKQKKLIQINPEILVYFPPKGASVGVV
jgi:hypothetical protein